MYSTVRIWFYSVWLKYLILWFTYWLDSKVYFSHPEKWSKTPFELSISAWVYHSIHSLIIVISQLTLLIHIICGLLGCCAMWHGSWIPIFEGPWCLRLFIFTRSWACFLAQRPSTLNDDYADFISPPKHMLGQFLKLGHYHLVPTFFLIYPHIQYQITYTAE